MEPTINVPWNIVEVIHGYIVYYQNDNMNDYSQKLREINFYGLLLHYKQLSRTY